MGEGEGIIVCMIFEQMLGYKVWYCKWEDGREREKEKERERQRVCVELKNVWL